MTIEPAAAQGFGRAADAYERGRPTYPSEAVEWMLGALGIGPGDCVVDLGAGTGKFTRLLVPSAARIIAIEPIAAMREEFARAVSGVEIFDGTAEAMPVQDGSADAVVAAQAFHWFATQQALVEIHRVLRPGGGLALIWNRRDRSGPVQASIDEIVLAHRGVAPAHEGDRWRNVLADNPLFQPAAERQFLLEQEVDQQGLIDRVVSISFIASMDAAERATIVEELKPLVPRDGRLVLRYRTDVFLFRAV
jgi:SAM-dependent methyltransferase